MSHVPLYVDLLGHFLKYQNFLKGFGNLETKLLTYDIVDQKVERPIFICGLARAGTTILLEVLASHPEIVTHQYKDYPFLHTNYFWNTIRYFIPSNKKKIERGHKDRIMINAESPEAFEEILWMSFFENLHNPKSSNILGKETKNPVFEKFYRDHIRKLLVMRKGNVYTTKNNYNLSRIGYLQKLFPDAKIIIPIRKAEEHIYSLLKQHRLICKAQENNPRASRYMARHGHFEFGEDFRPINLGQPEKLEQIQSLWTEGNHLNAYAHYWDYIYNYLHRDYAESPQDNIMFIPYDKLCGHPEKSLNGLFEFCNLEKDNIVNEWSDKISAPKYYNIDFSADEKQTIQDITCETQRLFWKS